MTRDTIYAIVAITGAVIAGIALGAVFIAVASIWYALRYGMY